MHQYLSLVRRRDVSILVDEGAKVRLGEGERVEKGKILKRTALEGVKF